MCYSLIKWIVKVSENLWVCESVSISDISYIYLVTTNLSKMYE